MTKWHIIRNIITHLGTVSVAKCHTAEQIIRYIFKHTYHWKLSYAFFCLLCGNYKPPHNYSCDVIIYFSSLSRKTAEHERDGKILSYKQWICIFQLFLFIYFVVWRRYFLFVAWWVNGEILSNTRNYSNFFPNTEIHLKYLNVKENRVIKQKYIMYT